jgi:hypothetical protein
MKQRFVQVLEEQDDGDDAGGEALGRFWPRAKRLTPRSVEGVVVDFTTWAGRRRGDDHVAAAGIAKHPGSRER